MVYRKDISSRTLFSSDRNLHTVQQYMFCIRVCVCMYVCTGVYGRTFHLTRLTVGFFKLNGSSAVEHRAKKVWYILDVRFIGTRIMYPLNTTECARSFYHITVFGSCLCIPKSLECTHISFSIAIMSITSNRSFNPHLRITKFERIRDGRSIRKLIPAKASRETARRFRGDRPDRFWTRVVTENNDA